MAKRIIRAYFWFQFLHLFPISLCFSTYVLFLQDNKLSLAEVGWVNFTWMLGIFIFEIPTGVVADVFGRKISVVIGVAIQGASLLVYYCSFSLTGFIVSETVGALGATFISGAIDAWLKDSLDATGTEHDFTRIFSSGALVEKGAVLIGGTLGGLIGVFDLRMIWLLAGIGQLIIAVVFWQILEEKYFVRKKITWRTGWFEMKKIAVDSIKFGWENHSVWWLIVVGTLFVMAGQGLNMQWAPFFTGAFGLEYLAILWFAISGVMMLGPILVNYFLKKKYFTERRLMAFSLALSGLPIVLIIFFPSAGLIFGLFLTSEIGRSAFQPLERAYLHDHLEADRRATVASFASMVEHAGAGVGWLASGFLAAATSIPICWLFGGLTFLAAIIFVGKLRNGK
jgi:MFS family permease